MPPFRPIEERIWTMFEAHPLGCWIWTGHRLPTGYGQISVGSQSKGTRKSLYAHRVAYEIEVGPIPEGLTLDHLCRTPACINPAHLEPVTQRENMRRGDGPSAVNARKTHCKRGHAFDEANTIRVARGRECRTCRRLRRAGHFG